MNGYVPFRVYSNVLKLNCCWSRSKWHLTEDLLILPYICCCSWGNHRIEDSWHGQMKKQWMIPSLCLEFIKKSFHYLDCKLVDHYERKYFYTGGCDFILLNDCRNPSVMLINNDRSNSRKVGCDGKASDGLELLVHWNQGEDHLLHSLRYLKVLWNISSSLNTCICKRTQMVLKDGKIWLPLAFELNSKNCKGNRLIDFM